MQVFARSPEDLDVLTWLELRKLVTDDYCAVMSEVKHDICIPVPESTNIPVDNGTKTNDNNAEKIKENVENVENLKTEKRSNVSPGKKGRSIPRHQAGTLNHPQVVKQHQRQKQKRNRNKNTTKEKGKG